MTQSAKKTQLLIANEFHAGTIEKLDEEFSTFKLWTRSRDEQQELIESLKESCKAVASASWQTNPLIYRLPELEIISCFGVGIDGIDLETTRSRHVKVTNTPGVLNDAVADIAIALILATQRNLINADQFVRAGSWPAGPFPLGRDLAGQTLGILGLGSIGEDIARRAETFKLNVAYHNRNQKNLHYKYYPSIKELAENSDILLCMLPGGSVTDAAVDLEVFHALGPEGTFLNVGRGTSVNEDHLIKALTSGLIAAAGLDVYRTEPKVRKELILMENVVLLPHIGSATMETRREMGNLVVKNLLAWQKGETLLTPVD